MDRDATNRPLPVFLVLIAVVVGIALLLPPGLRAIAVLVGFLAGAGFERYRQDHLPLPPSLDETPAAWWRSVRDEIGLVPALAALALIAAAASVVGLSITGDGRSPSSAPPPADTGSGAGQLPDLAIRQERVGVRFAAAGAEFRVAPADRAAWAASLPAAPGAGRRWFAAIVETSATTRSLDPASLSFRLTDSEGGLYHPDQHGTVGAASLTGRGFLRPGESAEVRLGFLVPVGAEDLALEFEPRPGGPSKVRVGFS